MGRVGEGGVWCKGGVGVDVVGLGGVGGGGVGSRVWCGW